VPDKTKNDKAHIFPQQSRHVFCEIYHCRNVAQWTVGKPVARNLCLNLCTECAKDILTSLPDELVLLLADDVMKDSIQEVVIPTGTIIASHFTGTTYTCKYCGKLEDTPQKIATHTRTCPMNPKNGGKSDEAAKTTGEQTEVSNTENSNVQVAQEQGRGNGYTLER
jgi:hypothetical protein